MACHVQQLGRLRVHTRRRRRFTKTGRRVARAAHRLEIARANQYVVASIQAFGNHNALGLAGHCVVVSAVQEPIDGSGFMLGRRHVDKAELRHCKRTNEKSGQREG